MEKWPNLHGPQESKILLHLEQIEHEATKVIRVGETLRYRHLVPTWKDKCGRRCPMLEVQAV